MFFLTNDLNAKILSVIEMGWQRVNARAGARPFHTLSYRLVGGATLLSDGKNPLHVEEDEITFVPANFDFSKQAGKGRIIAIHFMSESPLPKTFQRFTPQNPQHFRKAFQNLYTVWSSKQTCSEYESKILFYRIILDIERQWIAQTPSGRYLNTALSYISDHISDSNLSVDSLAKLCNMSDTYFRKLFVQEHHITPQRYINRLRLEAATELLRTGYYSVSEVSERCGFSNPNYFSIFVKKETGLSPLQYRKQLLNTAVSSKEQVDT